MTKKQINQAIAPLGLEIQHERGSGYSYFTALDDGEQAGESIMVCYLHSLTLKQWVKAAEDCVKELNTVRQERSWNVYPQLHAGVSTIPGPSNGQPLYHTYMEGAKGGQYWCGHTHSRTPEGLMSECKTTIKDLWNNHPELAPHRLFVVVDFFGKSCMRESYNSVINVLHHDSMKASTKKKFKTWIDAAEPGDVFHWDHGHVSCIDQKRATKGNN